ncbi:MAG TPA: glycosyltransferase family 2 protein [Puia sp.]|nr:glycosyltransferase family 2 protein [Puia sp.]
MTTPQVSVLITAFNREKYIGQAIESVLASSFGDFELIVVDDHSTDRTVEIVREYMKRDLRISLFVNEQNLGDYPNRNRAAGYASGKYLKYVDSDDLIYPWGLQAMVDAMERFPNAVMGISALERDLSQPFPFELSPRAAYEYNYQGPGLFDRSPLATIIRKKAFDESGGFPPLRMVGDISLWHHLAARHPVVVMSEGLVWNRLHDEQEWVHYSKFLAEYEKIRRQYLLAEDCPLDPQAVKTILRKRRLNNSRDLVQAFARFNLDESKEYLKIAWLYR